MLYKYHKEYFTHIILINNLSKRYKHFFQALKVVF